MRLGALQPMRLVAVGEEKEEVTYKMEEF